MGSTSTTPSYTTPWDTIATSDAAREQERASENQLAGLDRLLEKVGVAHLAWPPLARRPDWSGRRLHRAALTGLTTLLAALIGHGVWHGLSPAGRRELHAAAKAAADLLIYGEERGEPPDPDALTEAFLKLDGTLLAAGCRPAFAIPERVDRLS